LDAVNLNIQSVQIDNTQQRFDYDGEQLHIQLNSPSQVGKPVDCDRLLGRKPQRGIYFIAPDKHYPNKPTQVWTGRDRTLAFGSPDYQTQLAT